MKQAQQSTVWAWFQLRPDYQLTSRLFLRLLALIYLIAFLSRGIGHIYHVFPTMPTRRQELLIQGSQDGQTWRDYQFKYKPGALADRPSFLVPYQPRLDWMMWFVPTQSGRELNWFRQFQDRLLQGSPAVLALLENNPFPDQPPRFVRVLAYDYRFTSAEEHRVTGNWWRREYLGVFPYVEPRRP